MQPVSTQPQPPQPIVPIATVCGWSFALVILAVDAYARDGLQTGPPGRVLVPELCDGPKGNVNYPDGFLSEGRQFLHVAFDNNRRQVGYLRAKLRPLPSTGKDAEELPATPYRLHIWFSETAHEKIR